MLHRLDRFAAAVALAAFIGGMPSTHADEIVITPMLVFRVSPEQVKGTLAPGQLQAVAAQIIPEYAALPERVAMLRQWAADELARTIQPGWKRVGIEGADDIAASAFVSPDGKRFAVVIANTWTQFITAGISFEGNKARHVRVDRIGDRGEAESFRWATTGGRDLVGIAPHGIAIFTGTLRRGEEEPDTRSHRTIVP